MINRFASVVSLLSSSGKSAGLAARVFSPRCQQVPSFASRLIVRHASQKAPSFDAEVSRIYKIISENHRHPLGPWITMLEKIHNYANQLPKQDFSVLDLATGPGEPAETIARQFPQATIVATDISPDQVALAQRMTETLPHLTAQVADMENLVDFDDNNFDIVTCCYGFMFPPDIPKAVNEAYRVLKPGGILVATTWNRVGMMEKVQSIMERVLEETPPKPPINPLSLAEPGLFESILGDAGFHSLQVSTHEYPMDLTKDPEIQFKASTLPVKATLDELDAWAKAKEAYEAVKMDHGGYNDNGHWIVTGNEYKLTVANK
jgi:SAM-dependent methyltransferase